VSKVLITGANGFIGAAVCKHLRNSGVHMLTGTTRRSDLGVGPERVPMYHIPEIGPNTDWSKAISGADSVIHLAARVHVMKDQSADSLAAFRLVNTEGSKALAIQAAAAGVKRFVFISTVKVAGEISPEIGFTERNPAKPEDAYGISKWEAEQALTKIAKATGMEVVIFRPPLVYGPGVKGNFLSLFKAIQKGSLLPLGAIQNKRSLLYVQNLADVIAKTILHPNAGNQTFFVSDAETVSTPELVRKIAMALGKNPRLFNFPLNLLQIAGAMSGRSSAVKRLLGSLTIDSDHIRKQLSWEPPYSMEEGLKETANWFNSNVIN
jgi:nucleoside-diphosphate-sugar epimerase